MPLKSPPKKIAIVITRMDLGGAQEVALETARRLDPARFEVTLLAGPGGRLDGAAAQALGPRFATLDALVHPISPFKDLIAFFQLARYFYKNRTDIVHTHSSKAGLIGRAAAWAAGVPHIVHTVHGWSFHDEMKNPLRAAFIWMERRLASVTDVLAVVAESCRHKGLLNGVAGNYRLLRAAVDLGAWSKVRRRGAGLTVGCIANCKEQKNPLDFVRCAALVLKQAPKARFIYVGDGPLRARAEALAGELGLARQLRFPGWVDDPRAMAAGFDVFLLTSLWEGLPCVFPQVLAMGIPVVATNVDGAPEIIREGKNGYLCAPGDVEALADRVTLLLKNPALRRRMGTAARKGLSKEFGFPDMVKQTAAIYAAAA